MHRLFIRKLYLAALCCLFALWTSGQGTVSDSLLQIANSSKDPAKKIQAFIELSEQETNNLPKALYYASQATELAHKTENESGYVNSLIRLSQVYFLQSDFKKAMDVALEGKSLAEKLGKQVQLAILLDGIGLIYYNLGDKKECANYYFSSLKIAESLNNRALICKTYNRIGLLFSEQKDFGKAIEYLTKADSLALILDDKEGVAVGYNNIAVTYYSSGNYTKSLYFLKEALKISKAIGLENLEASHYLNMGKAYFKLKKYPLAMQYYSQALDIFTRLNIPPKAASCRLNIGEAQIAAGKYMEANINFNAALSIAKERGLKDIIYQSYKLLHELALKRADTSSAYNYNVLENQWKDSLAYADKERNLVKIELQYHFEKKEELEKQERGRRKLLNTAIIVTLALSIIIILLIMNQIRLRAKKSKLEKEGLEKELEFKKKELTINVMSLMKKSELLSDFSKKIIQFEQEATTDETRFALKRVGKELQKTSEEETLKEFSLRFKEVHKDFYDALLRKYPDLTPSELKLCAFLKLNLSTKEISELTGQRLNTLENARYRLRLKFGITNSEVNLVAFLSQI
ncbi:MAG: tetratricopeptide repeat protein [Bacteroidota bacterium]